MDSQKKVWMKPVLIVIGRGEPEERVLAACKVHQNPGSGHPNCAAPKACLEEVAS